MKKILDTAIMEWSNNVKPLSPAWQHCITTLLAMHAESKPNALAVTSAARELTYQQLHQVSNQLAQRLAAGGMKAGDRIAVLMDRSPDLIATILGILKLGAIYVPINPNFNAVYVNHVINDSSAKMVVLDRFNPLNQLIDKKHQALAITFAECLTFPKQAPNVTVTLDDLAYIMYALSPSGTLRGVSIKHASLMNLSSWYASTLQLNASDRIAQFNSSGYDSHLAEIIPPLAVHASIHIIDDKEKLSPPSFFHWLVQNQVTFCHIPGAYAELLFAHPWPSKAALRLVKVGGESITQYPKQRFDFDIWQSYGPVETTIEATCTRLYQAKTEPHLSSQLPPLGKPIQNTLVRVVNADGNPSKVDELGELYIGGAGLSTGYWDNPDLTAAHFVADPFDNTNSARFFRTGDLVCWSENGELQFKGRLKNHLDMHSERAELTQIETTLLELPDINEAVVVGKTPNANSDLAAYLVPDLDKIRIPHEQKILVDLEDEKFIQATTDNFSKEGIGLVTPNVKLAVDQKLRLFLQLPGMDQGAWFTGNVMWSVGGRAGIQFDSISPQRERLERATEYYLTTQPLSEALNKVVAKRSIRKALQSRLPESLIPKTFTVLTNMPHTAQGTVDVQSLPQPLDVEMLYNSKNVAPHTPTEKKLAEIWRCILKKEIFNITDNFFELGGTSQQLAELVVSIHHEFKQTLPFFLLFESPVIQSIANYLDSHGAQTVYHNTVNAAVNHDIVLDPAIIPVPGASQANAFKTVLLIGADEFMGAHVLVDLLKTTQATVYCLLSPLGQTNPLLRLRTCLQQYHLDKHLEHYTDRIQIISGDPALSRFGLDADFYDAFKFQIDTVLFTNPKINYISSYLTLRTANVFSTREIIRFACQGKNKSIHFISNLSAATKRDSDGLAVEEFPDPNYADLSAGYQVSLWVAECLLSQAASRGLPVSLYRFGRIWNNGSQPTPTDDALLRLITACITTEFAPDWQHDLSILPLPFAVKAFLLLAQQSSFGVYHLGAPVGLRFTNVISACRRAGFTIATVPNQLWQKSLYELPSNNSLFPLIPYFLGTTPTDREPKFSVAKTRPQLLSAGLDFPVFTEEECYSNILELKRLECLPEKV